MARANDAWGIEVGANAIKAVRLVLEGTSVRAAEYDILPFKQILTTPDLNVDEAIQINLDQFLSRHDVSKSTIVTSVPGSLAFARFAKLPPVEPKKIPDIVKFEAVQQIPFPIDQVEWDYQVFTQPDSPDVEVGIFAITRDRVSQVLANYRAVNMQVHALTLSPVAVYNAMAYDQNLGPESDGLIIVDIGTVSTDLIVVDAGDLWLRTVPIGGNNFTEALVRAFKLSFPKAEKLKREAGTSKYARQIFQAMRPVFADLVQEIQRSLGYYQSMNRDAKLTRLMGVGSTFRLPGLQKFLKQQLQMDVIRPDGFQKISVEGSQAADFSENAMNLVTAYGLALQGLDQANISANILPRHMLKQRIWKAKQPWIAAAACVAAAGAGLALFSQKTTIDSFDAMVQRDKSVDTAVLNLARQQKAEWDKATNSQDLRPRIGMFRRVLDYRDLLPKLTSDVMAAVATANKQSELNTADWSKIQAIPRDKRMKFYVESVDFVYGDVVAAPAGPGGDFGLPVGTGVSGRPGATPTATTEDTGMPKTITVVVKGYTPYKDYWRLTDAIVDWLKQHAVQSDRPYEIVVKDAQGKDMIERMHVQRTAGAGAGTVGPMPLMTPTPGPGIPGMPSIGPRSTIGREGGELSMAVDWKDMTLKDPTAAESTQSDWTITLKWQVRLLPPDKARQAQITEPGTPPTTQPRQSTGPEADAATTGIVQAMESVR